VTYVQLLAPELRPDEHELLALLGQPRPGRNRLFAFPAQSNFSGAQHPLEWIAYAQERGWNVLLDAAAFVPTNRLDLSRWHPDFVTLSFYKIFGYPTGVGCLLARKSALRQLRRPWFAGGTISIASVQGRGWHYLLPNEAGFEDGTVNYLTLPAVEIGLRHIAAIGTSALRNALNTQEFITTVKKKSGLVIRVISGEEEARLSLLGVRYSSKVAGTFRSPSYGPSCVIDVGGGSTEVISTPGAGHPVIASLPLGAVYLTERFLKRDPPCPDDLDRLRAAVRDVLDSRLGRLRCAGRDGRTPSRAHEAT
jgi:selenocysteine lyase/cysteine desulfurase